MDMIIDLNYSSSNKKLCFEMKELFNKGVKVSACNHFALRNSLIYKNRVAIKFLEHEYVKNGMHSEFNGLVEKMKIKNI